MAPKRLSRGDYRVGWICPLEVEQIAAMEMLDEEHETLPQPRSDTNIYNLGSINNHNIIIAGLPKAGNSSAPLLRTVPGFARRKPSASLPNSNVD